MTWVMSLRQTILFLIFSNFYIFAWLIHKLQWSIAFSVFSNNLKFLFFVNHDCDTNLPFSRIVTAGRWEVLGILAWTNFLVLDGHLKKKKKSMIVLNKVYWFFFHVDKILEYSFNVPHFSLYTDRLIFFNFILFRCSYQKIGPCKNSQHLPPPCCYNSRER
jgi:hypothetical protein